MNFFKKIRKWCPEPPNHLPTKLKHYSTSIAIVLAVTLFSVSFLVISSSYFFGSSAVKTLPVLPLSAQPFGNITIGADGSVVGTNSIHQIRNTYTLTANISGTIQVHKSNIVIDGAGYALNGNGGAESIGIDLQNNVTQVPSPQEIWNVTIENLAVINFNYSIETNGGGNNTLYNDYITNTISGLRGGIFLWGCQGNNITHCGISGQPAIFFDFCSSGNNVTKNNLSGGVWLELGGDETVDSNYWSDYLTKYPNAAEVDSSGAWNMPYQFTTYEAVGGVLQDDHPQINPIALPIFSSNTPTVSTNQLSSAVEFPLAVIALAVVLIASILAVFAYKRRRVKSHL